MKTAEVKNVTPPIVAARALRFALLAALLAGCQFPMRNADAPGVTMTPAQSPPDPALVQLAKRADAAIAAAGEGVGREYANRLQSEHRPAWIQHFKGVGAKPSHPALAHVVQDIEGLISLIQTAETWPEPGTFTIPKAVVPPKIDGRLDDEAWQHAAVWSETFPFNKTEPDGPNTTWKMTWNETFLYFAFDCTDADIVAAERERDGSVWKDDCVEMFIWSEPPFPVYWEIVIAPSGSVYDAVNLKRAHRWGGEFDPTRDVEDLQHAQQIRGTINDSSDVDEGYTVEVAIPFAALPGFTRRGPRAGDQLHLMLVRLDRTDGQFGAHAFRPLQGWGHNIWNHAVMELKD